jgi:hypothetical protein
MTGHHEAEPVPGLVMPALRAQQLTDLLLDLIGLRKAVVFQL